MPIVYKLPVNADKCQCELPIETDKCRRKSADRNGRMPRDAEKHRCEMQTASRNSQVAQMQQDAQALVHQQVANIQDRQTDFIEVRIGFAEVQGEHNVQQALFSLHIIANYCFEFIDKFQESYNTLAQNKKAVQNVGNPFKSNDAKAKLNDAEVAHRTIKDDVLIPALHKLMTAVTSFSAAIGSIQLRGASEGQITTVISNFEIHIRDLTDEVSKTSNVQIEKIKQHETEMRSLLDELSDKLKLDANDRLEAKFIEKQEKLLLKMQAYVLPRTPLIESTLDLSSIRNT